MGATPARFATSRIVVMDQTTEQGYGTVFLVRLPFYHKNTRASRGSVSGQRGSVSEVVVVEGTDGACSQPQPGGGQAQVLPDVPGLQQHVAVGAFAVLCG